MNKLITLLLLLTIACAGNKREKKSEFYIIEPNTRMEKFPKTFNLKGEGIVKTNCPNNTCNSDQADDIKLELAKSFIKDGVWQEYREIEDDDKKKKYSSLILKGNYKDGKKNGIWQEFTEKSKSGGEKINYKTNEGEYIDDVKNGVWTQFYESGNKAKQTPYKEGKKNGTEQKFSSKGEVTEETTYAEDSREGNYFKKSSSGSMICQGNFSKDKKQGKWIEYNSITEKPNVLKFEFNFIDGKKEGAAIFYAEDGTKSQEGNYKNDYKIAYWKDYFPSGQIRSEGNKKAQPGENEKDLKELDSSCPSPNSNGKSTNIGEWKNYYKSGDLFSIGNYDEKGQPSKDWQFFYKGNKLKAKGEMGNALMMKNGVLYEDNGNVIGKGNLMLSMFTLDEKNDTMNSKAIPALPFTFFKNGKKHLELLDANNKEGEEKRTNITAIEYDTSGNKVGEGSFVFIPTQDFGGKKHGCWKESGKTVSYMMGKIQTGALASMSGCK